MMPKTMATAAANLWPALISFARKGRDEQRINAISRRRTSLAKNVKIPSASADLPPVLGERQSASVVREQG
jgi:hypothetical protein